MGKDNSTILGGLPRVRPFKKQLSHSVSGLLGACLLGIDTFLLLYERVDLLHAGLYQLHRWGISLRPPILSQPGVLQCH